MGDGGYSSGDDTLQLLNGLHDKAASDPDSDSDWSVDINLSQKPPAPAPEQPLATALPPPPTEEPPPPPSEEPPRSASPTEETGSRDTPLRSSMMSMFLPWQREPPAMKGTLVVKVLRATHLKGADHGGTSSDAYVKLVAGRHAARTKPVHGTLHPEWNETVQLEVDDVHTPLQVQVFDHDRFSLNDAIGDAEVSLLTLPAGHATRLSLELQHVETGTVELEATWCPREQIEAHRRTWAARPESIEERDAWLATMRGSHVPSSFDSKTTTEVFVAQQLWLEGQMAEFGK